MSDNDIRGMLSRVPSQKVLVDEDGVMIDLVTISDVFKTPYRKCSTCYAKHRCSRVQKKGNKFLDVDCVIEKEALEVLMTRLSYDGVTAQDELVVFPIVRNAFKLIRMYEVESIQDLSRAMRDEDFMKVYKDLNGMINQAETMILKYMKELLATRKEDKKNTLKDVSEKFDLAKRLKEKRRIANENKQLNQG